MNKPKHTPGPWTFEGRDILSTARKNPYLSIGTVNATNGEANARLIAAAPSMYTLLHQIWAKTDPSDKTSWIIAELLDQIDATGGAE